MNTQQKVAVITGASQGIGSGIVKAFIERGFNVVANWEQPQLLSEDVRAGFRSLR